MIYLRRLLVTGALFAGMAFWRLAYGPNDQDLHDTVPTLIVMAVLIALYLWPK